MKLTRLLALTALLTTPFLAAETSRAQNTETCWCFSWVHGPDHGTSCRATAPACRAAAAANTRDHTPCRPHEEVGVCRERDDAFIRGEHVQESR